MKDYTIEADNNGKIFLHGIYSHGQLQDDMCIDFVSTDNDFLIHEIMSSIDNGGIIRVSYKNKPCDLVWWRSKHCDKTRLRGLVFYADDIDYFEIMKYALEKKREKSDIL